MILRRFAAAVTAPRFLPFYAAAAIALSLVTFSSSSATARGDENARLQALRERIERLRSALAASEGERDEAREELRSSERAISASNRILHELGAKRRTAAAELEDLAARKKALEATVAEREKAIGRLLTALYVAGNNGNLKLLLSGQDPSQTARELQYLAYVSRAQADLARALRSELIGLRQVEERLREGTARMESIEQAQQTTRDELLKQQAARRKTLARASAKIGSQSREVKTLERDEARLARLVREIARVTAAPPARERNGRVPGMDIASRFAELKGHLRLPIRGVLVHAFGSVRAGGGPNWKGIFIRSLPGQEVRAVAGGRVVFAEWMRGYGNLLILDHGGGYMTIYGNNESLLKAVGDPVGAADAIALVGASGGGQETGLYFESRYEGKAFDPMSWARLH